MTPDQVVYMERLIFGPVSPKLNNYFPTWAKRDEDSLFPELFDDIFNDGHGFATTRDNIAEGEKQVAWRNP